MIRSPTSARPFLSWAGGKHQLLPHLLTLLPGDLRQTTYCEPFLGAGSLFFAASPKHALLSDANGHLIDCYAAIRERHENIARLVARLSAEHGARHYYKVRDRYNDRSQSSQVRSAEFIYLNKSCFNGIFRVNKQGKFNVPFGYKKRPRFPTLADLRPAAAILKGARLRVADYQVEMADYPDGVFVYLDPPYPPLNGTSYFTHYTKERFGEADQWRLRNAIDRLMRKGCQFLMTNADTPLIRTLYSGFRIERLSVCRYVSSGQKKHRVYELAIRNY